MCPRFHPKCNVSRFHPNSRCVDLRKNRDLLKLVILGGVAMVALTLFACWRIAKACVKLVAGGGELAE